MNATTGAALLQAILDDPDDDIPRLVYADWLEEEAGGYSARAELIRIQCELTSSECECGEMLRYVLCRHCVLARRLDRLLNQPCDCSWHAPLPHTTQNGYSSWKYNRGFIERVECPCNEWLIYGPLLVRTHTIQTVKLIDKIPSVGYVSGLYRWYCSVPGWRESRHNYSDLPLELFNHLRMDDWVCEADAVGALSQTCLSWAKSQPPLIS